MKKIKFFYTFIFLALIFLPNFSFAAGLVPCGTTESGTMCTMCDLIVGMNNIINYVFTIAGIAAIVAIFVGAFMYIFSGASPALAEKGKNAITNALVGIILVVSAWLMVNYAMKVIGVGKAGTENTKGITEVLGKGWNKFECKN
jgi:hypothetical protein